MHVHKRLLRYRNVEQRVGLARHFGHAPAHQQHQVCALDPLEQHGVQADTDIADEAGVIRREEHLTPERHRDGQLDTFGKGREFANRGFIPAGAPKDCNRGFGSCQTLGQRGHLRRGGAAIDGCVARRIGYGGQLDEHVFRQCDFDGTGPA